jgi:hypothetical protein
METIIHRLGPPVQEHEKCSAELEQRPTFDSPRESVNKETAQAAAAAESDSARTAKIRRTGSSLSSVKRKSFSNRVNQEVIPDQPPSCPSNLTPSLKTPQTVNPLLSSASVPSNVNAEQAAVKAVEAKHARQAVVRVLLGPPVGDLTRLGSSSDGDSSRCCLWPSGCLLRRTEGPDNSSNSDSNRAASVHVAEHTSAANSTDFTVAAPSGDASGEAENHDKRKRDKSGIGGGNSSTDQVEIEIGGTENSMDNKTHFLAYSDFHASATSAHQGLARTPVGDFALTSVAPACQVHTTENASPLIAAAPTPAQDVELSNALDTDATIASTSSEANAAQGQANVDPASVAAPQAVVDATEPDTGTKANQLGGCIDAILPVKIEDQQGWDIGIPGFQQLLIDLRQVSVLIGPDM